MRRREIRRMEMKRSRRRIMSGQRGGRRGRRERSEMSMGWN